MIDFDTLLNGPVASTFGQACQYLATGATAPVPISAVFFEGYHAIDDGMPPPAQSQRPMLGVQLSQLLAPVAPAVAVPWTDAKDAQGDLVTIADGRQFAVKSGQPDGVGWAKFELEFVA